MTRRPAAFRLDDPHVIVATEEDKTRLARGTVRVLPEAKVRVGRRVLPVESRVAEGEERARLWKVGQTVNPMWQSYQERTERQIPVVVLTPR